MKNYNNPNPSWQEVGVNQFSVQETVGTIQNISKNIRDYSLLMRGTMKTLRDSGAIPEFADAIREGSFAVRDTVKDIKETAQELKNKGVVVETASAVENTLKSAEESISTVKEISGDAERASPLATKAVQNGFATVKRETSQVTGKVMEGIKTKVGA